MDMMTAIFAANKAKKELAENGQIGSTSLGETIKDVDLESYEEAGMSIWAEDDTAVVLVAGETYSVVLDSGTYSAVCKRETLDGSEVDFLGNSSLSGFGADTGESFLVAVDNQPTICIVDANGGTHCTLKGPETTHTIDPKFLPGAVLPVVEITTEPTEEGTPCTAEENAALNAAVATGMPPVVKMTAMGQTFVMSTQPPYALAATVGTLAYGLYSPAGDGTWLVMMVEM